MLWQFSESGVSGDDKRIIVKAHNDVRTQIAHGDLPGQPKGKGFKTMVNMSKLKYHLNDICIESLAKTFVYLFFYTPFILLYRRY